MPALTLTDPAAELARLVELTEALLMYADHVEELAAERELDAQEAHAGRIRVACTWCDGEFHTYPAASPAELDLNGGYSCRLCDHMNGY